MYTVRPLQKPSKNIFRVNVSAAALLLLKLQSGDLCRLQDLDGHQHEAIVWLASEKIQDTIVQTSRPLQEICGFKLGDKISILPHEKTVIQQASHVSLRDVSNSDPLTDDDRAHWEWYLQMVLPTEHDMVTGNQKLSFTLGMETRDFILDSGQPLSTITSATHFEITSGLQDGEEASPDQTRFSSFDAIGGLKEEIARLRGMIDNLKAQTPSHALPTFYRPTQGILLYGSKGTGKSLLIEAVAASSSLWRSVHHWKPGENVVLGKLPALFVIENLEVYADRNALPSKVLHIRDLFRQIRGLPCLVLAEVRHPNNIHESLRSAGKFEQEVELPIPSRQGRSAIVKAIRGTSPIPEDEWIEQAADKTHGYVGADLYALLQTATRSALRRRHQAATIPTTQVNGGSQQDEDAHTNHYINAPSLQYTADDLQQALLSVRPSALQEVFLETPNVHWSDIGGQSQIKQRLIESVTWPLTLSARMKSLNLRPTKGILLYGPPGCSKTLLVKALATESGLNFLAVKGAELISMYVGESERAIREIFRKARAASPSIVFFDEIDAIATARSSGGQKDLNVLTTLLNEMDGFEELRGVLVVAATNKPQLIDPALMRPGRLDSVLYVGPPDTDTRREILRAWFAKSQVDDVVSLADATAHQTEGYSGAELIGICETAGRTVLRSHRRAITAQDLEAAIAETPRGITRETLREFEDWHAARR